MSVPFVNFYHLPIFPKGRELMWVYAWGLGWVFQDCICFLPHISATLHFIMNILLCLYNVWHTKATLLPHLCHFFSFHFISLPLLTLLLSVCEVEREGKEQTAHPQRGRVTLQNHEDNPRGWPRDGLTVKEMEPQWEEAVLFSSQLI